MTAFNPHFSSAGLSVMDCVACNAHTAQCAMVRISPHSYSSSSAGCMMAGQGGPAPDVTVYINHGASTQTATTLYRTVKAASVPTGSDYTLPVSTHISRGLPHLLLALVPGSSVFSAVRHKSQINQIIVPPFQVFPTNLRMLIKLSPPSWSLVRLHTHTVIRGVTRASGKCYKLQFNPFSGGGSG